MKAVLGVWRRMAKDLVPFSEGFRKACLESAVSQIDDLLPDLRSIDHHERVQRVTVIAGLLAAGGAFGDEEFSG